MKTKILFLLTADYPYGTGETFLESEIGALANRFKHIYIFSGSNHPTITRQLPANVSAHKLMYAPDVRTKLSAITQLFSAEVWRDRNYVRSLGAFKTALISQANSKRLAHQLLGYVKDQLRSHAPTDVVLYAYWLNDFALAAYHLKKQIPALRAVSRAHRWDIYEEEQPLQYLPFRRSLLHVLDTVYVISQDGVSYMQRYNPSTRVVCSRLGTFQSLQLQPFQAPPMFTIVSISLVIPRKRLRLLWQVIQHMNVPVHWIHFGDGPEREALMHETHTSGMHRVSWMGHQDNAAVKKQLSELNPHVLINLSESEGIPVSMMEAMSSGIPVVATRVGGVPEIVVPGVNGWLVSPNPNVGEVSELLQQIATMPVDSFQALRKSTFLYWQTHYNAAVNFEQFAADLSN